MKAWLLVLAVCTCSGCTMFSLTNQSVRMADTTIDLRYHEVMQNLARIANDPSTLPSYTSIFAGTSFVQDQGEVITNTVWPWITKVGVQTVNPQLNRQVGDNWALDPTVIPERLEAMRAACQWAIGGPEHVYKDSMSLLISPNDAPPGPGRHFNVAEKLSHLPPGWLCVGHHKCDVPAGACYKAHCGHTWVWVMPDGMQGLTDFTLIIQYIARVIINSPTLFHLPPSFAPIVFPTVDKDMPLQTFVQVTVNQGGQLVAEQPWYAARVETTGNDSTLRSQISAAGTTPLPGR